MSIPDPVEIPETINYDRRDIPVPPAIEALDLVSEGPPQFEFTSAQEKLIRDLARKMRFVGLAFLVIGIATPIVEFAAVRSVRLDLAFLVYILIGIWTFSAGNAFMKVVETHGRDITHVMDALGALKSMYGLIFWLLIAALVVVALVFIWVLFGGAVAVRIA